MKIVEFWADLTMLNGDVLPYYMNGVGWNEGMDFAKEFDDTLMDDIVKMLGGETMDDLMERLDDGLESNKQKYTPPTVLTSYDHFTYDEDGHIHGHNLRAIPRDKILYATLRYNIQDKKS